MSSSVRSDGVKNKRPDGCAASADLMIKAHDRSVMMCVHLSVVRFVRCSQREPPQLAFGREVFACLAARIASAGRQPAQDAAIDGEEPATAARQCVHEALELSFVEQAQTDLHQPIR